MATLLPGSNRCGMVDTARKYVIGYRGIQDFKDIMTVNILGPYLVVRALLPLIRKGKKKQVMCLSWL